MADTTFRRNKTLPDYSAKSDFHDLIDTATLEAINITNADIASNAAISDSKLAQITTAGKVSGSAITGLALIPAGAGVLPVVNGGTGSSTGDYCALTGDQTIAGVKTFTSFPITPSSAPTANYQVANKKYVDDQIAAGMVSAFGAWAVKTNAVTYLAATDGFVSVFRTHVTGECSDTIYARIYTDTSNPPTTLRAQSYLQTDETNTNQKHGLGCSCPVRKGEYWKADVSITATGTYTVFWLPLGS